MMRVDERHKSLLVTILLVDKLVDYETAGTDGSERAFSELAFFAILNAIRSFISVTGVVNIISIDR